MFIAFNALTGCLGCKTIVVPANPNLDPVPNLKVSDRGSEDDPLLGEQWAMNVIDAAPVWDGEAGSRKIRVGIISSGIDYNHLDLRAQISVNRTETRQDEPGTNPFTPDFRDNDGNGYVDDFIGYDFVENDGLPFDRVGIGTEMAGVLAAGHNNGHGIRGVARTVSIVPIKYINDDGLSTVAHLIKALGYASRSNLDVVTLQLANIVAADDAQIREMEMKGLRVAFDQLAAQQVPVVIGAGQSGVDLSQSEGLLAAISGRDNVVVVTSTDRGDLIPFIANTGMSVVHISAPGKDVLTTQPMSTYGRAQGTHIAAAYVAGALAAGMDRFGTQYSASEYIEALLSDNGNDRIESHRFRTVSGGRLNLSRLVNVLERGL